MFKKLILLVLTALSLTSVNAQQAVGEWTIYPIFIDTIDQILDTKTKVYYLVSNRLYSYDKESNESYAYSTQNKLSDTNITGMYYNRDKGYLLLAYDTGNIDVLYDNGKVVNLGDIKDANLTTAKTINTVSFGKDRIYVGTIFGLVIFNDKKLEVVESCMLDTSITCVAEMGDYIVIFADDSSYKMRGAKINARHNTLDSFTEICGCNASEFVGINDKYMIQNTSTTVYVRELDLENMKSLNYHALVGKFNSSTNKQIGRNDDSYYYTTSDNKLVSISKTDTISSSTALPSDFSGQSISFYNSLSSVWASNSDGVANYDASSGSAIVLIDKFKPQASVTKQTAYIRASADGSRIYFSNLGPTRFKTIGDTSGNEGYNWRQRMTVLKNGVPYSATLTSATADFSSVASIQKSSNYYGMFGGNTRFIVDPDNPDRYYSGNGKEGVYVCENGEQVGKFYTYNSPMIETWGCRVYDVNMDKEGNLWVGTVTNTYDLSPYFILPKDKLKDPASVTKEDWCETKHKGYIQGGKDMGSVICTKSNMVITWESTQGVYPYAYDTKGTWTDTSDDEIRQLSDMTDQDGKSFYATRWICGVEDQKGRVWLGTTSGIIEITNPANAMDPTMTINHLKVPRNDGTDYADYLLETEQVNDIAVDSSNRKWIATESSGVYLVSADGDKIISHFTTENSDLPANAVYCVLCDPNNNTVYFGLASGAVSYSSTSSPAADDYSSVYAYPNPVRPDYTGWITISGLMSNSLVKIADASGNVFYQTRSEGGMVIWDGCGSNGERVKSGVYFVLASQNSDGSNMGVVTKIMVIN